MASEVLKRSLVATLSNSEQVLIDGVDGHTYTILGMTFCETAGNSEELDVYIDENGAGTDYYILKNQAIGAKETFEYTGRIVIDDTDHLCAITASSADIDCVITYLDQTR